MATAEEIVYGALASLASGNVFPDLAPPGTPAPWITYQAAGGIDHSTLDDTASTLNARMQIDVWSHSRAEASDLMAQIRTALKSPPIRAVPIGAPVSSFESDTLLYGSRLDFSITYS
ncbi:hypothetical protein R6138_01893 [Ralstonia thomasii]|uniref:DUF3168 domain-containing protein n=1 Tax=Ralstonia thomasii TaxID=3058596 RepID=UPI0028F5AA5F|nr:DUF3168 domain-containing protein [Ralstonia sp. LMG 18095]CAJ0873035.1 hypothetical protein R6138_01893 [Ralstonia sp. LMG 18095]